MNASALVLLLPSLWLGTLPVIDRPVTDPEQLLSAQDTERVARELVRLRSETGTQMAVLVVSTTGGEPIEDYAVRAAQAWKGGQAGQNNGLLFVLAVNDRRMRLEVGYGLEEYLPDDAVRRLLDAQGPLMRQRDYAGALVQIIQGVGERLPGGLTSDPAVKRGTHDPLSDAIRWTMLAGFLLAAGGVLAMSHSNSARAGSFWRVVGAGLLVLTSVAFFVHAVRPQGISAGSMLMALCVFTVLFFASLLFFQQGSRKTGVLLTMSSLYGGLATSHLRLSVESRVSLAAVAAVILYAVLRFLSSLWPLRDLFAWLLREPLEGETYGSRHRPDSSRSTGWRSPSAHVIEDSSVTRPSSRDTSVVVASTIFSAEPSNSSSSSWDSSSSSSSSWDSSSSSSDSSSSSSSSDWSGGGGDFGGGGSSSSW